MTQPNDKIIEAVARALWGRRGTYEEPSTECWVDAVKIVTAIQAYEKAKEGEGDGF